LPHSTQSCPSLFDRVSNFAKTKNVVFASHRWHQATHLKVRNNIVTCGCWRITIPQDNCNESRHK
jgi:hypothetical protein